MNTHRSLGRRIIAVLGAAAIGLVGLTGAATAADADGPIPGNIDAGASGSIIIHKHVQNDESTPGNPAGDGLEGVTFRVTEVLLDGASVPLATAEGWTAIEGLTPAGVPGADFTRGESQEVKTGDGGVVTAPVDHIGLYLVEEISSGENLITAPADPFLVTVPYPNAGNATADPAVPAGWEYNVDVYPKNTLGEVTPTKTAGTPDKPADLELGAVVPFTISVPVAKPALPYESFSITDALSAGLTFDSWGEIKIGDTVLTAGTANDYTISTDNKTVTLTDDGITKLNTATATDKTTVTAVINAKVTALGQLTNTATATINGKPGDTPEVKTNWARLDITKQDKSTKAKLAGATFKLYAEDKTTLLATGTTNASGELSFVVWVGNDTDTTEVVYLEETVAPQGYVLPADPWTGPLTLTAGATAEASVTAKAIDNYKAEGPELPLTGANGELLMTIGGAALVLLAGGTALVARKRKHQA